MAISSLLWYTVLITTGTNLTNRPTIDTINPDKFHLKIYKDPNTINTKRLFINLTIYRSLRTHEHDIGHTRQYGGFDTNVIRLFRLTIKSLLFMELYSVACDANTRYVCMNTRLIHPVMSPLKQTLYATPGGCCPWCPVYRHTSIKYVLQKRVASSVWLNILRV